VIEPLVAAVLGAVAGAVGVVGVRQLRDASRPPLELPGP